jgi:hypothetical protein
LCSFVILHCIQYVLEEWTVEWGSPFPHHTKNDTFQSCFSLHRVPRRLLWLLVVSVSAPVRENGPVNLEEWIRGKS